MTIKGRLWLLVSILIALLVVMGGINQYATSSLSAKMDIIVELTNARAEINKLLLFTRANREQVMLALQHDPINPAILALHDHPVTMHYEAMDKNRAEAGEALNILNAMRVVNALVGQEMKDLYEIRTNYISGALNPTIELLKAGKYALANASLIQKMNPDINAIFKKGDEVFKVINAHIQQQEREASALSRQLSLISTIDIVLSIGLGILLALMINRSIRGAISEVSQAISQSARAMTFRTQLPNRTDEFSGLTQSVNQLFEGLQHGLQETNTVISAIAEGNLSKRINGNYVGDLEVLKQGINTSADSIAKVMTELSSAMSALQSGELSKKLNTNAQGQYGQMLSDASQAMTAFNIVIGEIVSVMHKMSEGDFSIRVNADARGDLLTMKNNINTSMAAIAQAIDAISAVVGAQAQGDLTKELPSNTFKGQLHDLKNAINYSSDKVKKSVIQAIDASNIVNEAASQVSQGSADLSGRVQEQAAALEETSATMNEMAAAVQANTSNAKKVAELAHQVQHQAGAGVDVMQQTIGAMQSIKESSSKIADIVTIIDGIAFQTNLLALNAAVEAARAGEHGRGFAVVAGEVRALAQKSADAAKDIKHLITDSVTRIEAGTQLADKSGEMLSGITGSIEQVAEMIEAIANASSEQTQGIHQVHKAIADIDKVTQENAALVEETTAAAESLSTEANHLKENMGFFKTGTTSNAHYHAKVSHPNLHKAPSRGLPTPANSGKSNEWSNF